MRETDLQPETQHAAGVIAKHARSRGIDPASFATAWTLANPLVTGAIAGPRTMEQWQTYLRALTVRWIQEDEQVVDRLVRPGTTAVPQFVDSAYPVEGRPQPIGGSTR